MAIATQWQIRAVPNSNFKEVTNEISPNRNVTRFSTMQNQRARKCLPETLSPSCFTTPSSFPTPFCFGTPGLCVSAFRLLESHRSEPIFYGHHCTTTAQNSYHCKNRQHKHVCLECKDINYDNAKRNPYSHKGIRSNTHPGLPMLLPCF
jgi:hypothetical protein